MLALRECGPYPTVFWDVILFRSGLALRFLTLPYITSPIMVSLPPSFSEVIQFVPVVRFILCASSSVFLCCC